jgi:hypothetical protein
MSTFNVQITGVTIGTSLLSFNFYGCTGIDPSITGTTEEKLKDCNYLTGCTALSSHQNVTGLTSNSNINLTGLQFDPLVNQMKWVKMVATNIASGAAEFECEVPICRNFQIGNIPTYTPTPIPATPTPLPATNTPIPATSTPLPATVTPLPATVTPLPATNTPTPLPATNTPTPTATIDPGGLNTMLGVKSGATLNDVCPTGSGTPVTIYFSGTSIQLGEKLYSDTNLPNPTPVANGYYYYPTYNTIYVVTGGLGAVTSTTDCPTPTPITGTITNAVVSLVDGSTACGGGDYDDDPSTPGVQPKFFNLTVYGSNIVNAIGIIEIPSFLLADFSANQEFYVRGRVAPDFYWKKFILDGDPANGATTATADGAAVLCP